MNANQLPENLIQAHLQCSAAFKSMRAARSKATIAMHEKASAAFRECIFAFVSDASGKPDQDKYNATKVALEYI